MEFDPERSKAFRKVAILSGIPFALAGGLIFGGVMGKYADAWLGTGPWLALVGAIFGLAAGARVTADFIKQANREDEK